MNDYDGDGINPAVPASHEALFAEELTMDPYTPLPSFLEMAMIEEAAASARRTLESGMKSASASLEKIAEGSSGETMVQRVKRHCASSLKKVMDRYGPEIRFLVAYLVERQCINSSACATVAE